jgi:hypothetical protein
MEKEAAFQKSSWPQVGFHGDLNRDFMGIVLLNMIVYMSISNNHNDFSLGLNQQNLWHMF